ncbi:MAG: GNAT family N-acetyltransferase [Pyrinomonadaceae bacterium]|nr:GNAT family N-acetyltransferase [Pyrinomonadaceae bacterium]
MELKIIEQDEDKAKDAFDSADCQLLLEMYEGFYPQIGFHPPWVGYFVVRGGRIVGSCGFAGQPQDGRVEVAYWTFKEFEGLGVASFACKELTSIAYRTDPSLTVTAKTAPEKNASTSILEKNGFAVEGIVQDHEIGDAWLWVHQKETGVF